MSAVLAAALVTRIALVAAPPVTQITATSDVRACLDAGHGQTLAATAGGLVLVDEAGAVRAVLTRAGGLLGTRVYAVERVASATGDEVWVGTEGGLSRVRVRATGLRVTGSWPGPAVRAIQEGPTGLWLGTWGGGVQRLTPGSAAMIPVVHRGAGPASLRVTSLARHRGVLYAGTQGAGVLRFDDPVMRPAGAHATPRAVFALTSHGDQLHIGALRGHYAGGRRLSTDDVRALRVVAARLRVGTYGAGAHGLPALPVGGRFVNGLGDGCVATRDGLFLARARGWIRARTAVLESGDIAAIAADGPRLWIGTFDAGLYRLEGGSLTRVRSPLMDRRVNALAIDARGLVWVGTPRGLISVDRGRVRRLVRADGLPSNDIHSLRVLRSGAIAAGTGKGLALVRGGRVTAINGKQGLWVRSVWAIEEDEDGRLYVGTSKGVFRKRRGWGWQRLATVTGHLRDDWVTSLAFAGADLYVGTYNAGVTVLTQLSRKRPVAAHLAGGWVNFGGLHVAGGTLYAGTMDGLLARPLGSGDWAPVGVRSLGKDVTAVAPVAGGLWIATRRGLMRLRSVADSG